jgi:hypothetical protein
LDSIVEAVGSPEFVTGLRWGAITAAAALLVGIAWRRWRQEPAPVAGLAVAVAVALGMPVIRSLDLDLLAGVGLLAVAGALFPWTRRIPVFPILLALPGAWLIGRSDLPGPGWVIPLVIATIALGGPVISWFDERSEGSPVPMVLFAIAVAGVWATVPDTEEALVLLGAMAIPTLLAWPLRVARIGPIGAHTLIALYMWVVAWGGRGREGSIVGAAAALGMLVAAPIGSWVSRRTQGTESGRIGLALVGLQLLVVGITTRVAGLQFDAGDAATIALPTLVGASVLWMVIEGLIGPTSAHEPGDGAPSFGG